MAQRVSAATMARVRDYACDEPSFTIAFAAWELGLSVSAIGSCVEQLLKMGTVHEIEARRGPYAAVYAYRPLDGAQHVPALRVVGDDEPVADLAARRNVVVPHTRARGESDTPGKTRKRQQRGVRVKRSA